MSPNVCLSATKVSKGHVESAAKREGVGESGIKQIRVGQVKYVRAKCLANDTNIKTMTQRGEKHDIFIRILPQVGFETAWQAAPITKRHALAITSSP